MVISEMWSTKYFSTTGALMRAPVSSRTGTPNAFRTFVLRSISLLNSCGFLSAEAATDSIKLQARQTPAAKPMT